MPTNNNSSSGSSDNADSEPEIEGFSKTFKETNDSSSSSENKASSDPETDIEGLLKTFAKCKWFNVAKGFGFVSHEDPPKSVDGKPPPDIFVYQKVIKMPGFRSLREGERVEVWYKKSAKGLEAVKVSGPGGQDCKGSEKRPKNRKTAADRCRCYNCDDKGHHAKECKLPPLPKRCHHCKSVEHLVADCTLKRDKSSASSKQQNTGTRTSPKQSPPKLNDRISQSPQSPQWNVTEKHRTASSRQIQAHPTTANHLSASPPTSKQPINTKQR